MCVHDKRTLTADEKSVEGKQNCIYVCPSAEDMFACFKEYRNMAGEEKEKAPIGYE